MQTQRALTALQKSHPDKLAPAIGALFQAFWARHEPVHEAETLRKVLGSVLPGGEKDAAMIVERAGEKEIKNVLQKRTEELVNDGAFGLPWFIGKSPHDKLIFSSQLSTEELDEIVKNDC